MPLESTRKKTSAPTKAELREERDRLLIRLGEIAVLLDGEMVTIKETRRLTPKFM